MTSQTIFFPLWKVETIKTNKFHLNMLLLNLHLEIGNMVIKNLAFSLTPNTKLWFNN